jgi:DNA segregation ATPase FtsK/SpoIIIE-like protein
VVADVPRPDRQTVRFAEVRGQLPPPDQDGMGTHIPIGINLEGKLRSVDLASNAHVLVAGTTGSGKSEWLRMALAGLLVRNTPDTLRVVCIDPKMNAFGDMKRSPFLWNERSLIYPPEDSALDAFEGLVAEMLRRQSRFEEAGADDLRQYVRKTGEMVPRIVCFCDEYANLIGTRQDRNAVEEQISRLGSMGRSSGIHLVIATQQPSRKVVGGALQTNMPCRVALMTKSAIESRMLIEESGAENLLGRGDLLLWDLGRPRRLQAPYLSEAERQRIYAGAQE